jgi:DNA replication protein DnaC
MDMLNHLLASQVDHSLVRKLKVYTEPPLLVCDELGYLSLDQQTSNLFYQVISTRHSRKRSTLITTKHTVLRLGQHPLQHDDRHRHCRSIGRKLRSLFARWRQLAQDQQESESAGRLIAPVSRRRSAVVISRYGGVRRVTPQRRCWWGRASGPYRFNHV